MIPYELIRAERKKITINITWDGRVTVRAPLHTPEKNIQRFVESKQGWIEGHLAAIRQRRAAEPPFTRAELQQLADAAKRDLPLRVAYYAQRMGVSYGKITIRAQKSRWGSCTPQGNLNFNCLMMLFPEAVRDYVVVHELCHRLQMNHSPRFWAEVRKVMPNYNLHVQWLKANGPTLCRRLRAMDD